MIESVVLPSLSSDLITAEESSPDMWYCSVASVAWMANIPPVSTQLEMQECTRVLWACPHYVHKAW